MTISLSTYFPFWQNDGEALFSSSIHCFPPKRKIIKIFFFSFIIIYFKYQNPCFHLLLSQASSYFQILQILSVRHRSSLKTAITNPVFSGFLLKNQKAFPNVNYLCLETKECTFMDFLKYKILPEDMQILESMLLIFRQYLRLIKRQNKSNRKIELRILRIRISYL